MKIIRKFVFLSNLREWVGFRVDGNFKVTAMKLKANFEEILV